MGQTQFRSDDTQKWWLGFGNGSDGDYSSAGNATDAPVDSSCSGTAGSTSLSATNASFAAGKPVLIHQSRGTNAGNWELNQIDSYVAGTITLKKVLQNTYTDSGASQAQVIQLKQYNNFTQNTGHTLTAKAWNGDVGGIIAFLAKGTVTIDGIITLSGKGYRGTTNYTGISDNGFSGEGPLGEWVNTRSARSSASGGGGYGASGGAGHASAGADAGTAATRGVKGEAVGVASLTSLFFGGAAGQCIADGTSRSSGGYGGGILLVIGNSIVIGSGASIITGGTNGTTANGPQFGSGGGAGGSILLKCKTATLNTNKLTAPAGVGNKSSAYSDRWGGDGSVGRIHLDYSTSYTGTTNPTIDVRQDVTIKQVSSGGGAILYKSFI